MLIACVTIIRRLLPYQPRHPQLSSVHTNSKSFSVRLTFLDAIRHLTRIIVSSVISECDSVFFLFFSMQMYFVFDCTPTEGVLFAYILHFSAFFKQYEYTWLSTVLADRGRPIFFLYPCFFFLYFSLSRCECVWLSTLCR